MNLSNTTPSPASSSPASGFWGRALETARLYPALVRSLFGEHRQWLWLLVPYLLAWIQPVILCWPQWGPGQTLAYQPFIPFAAILLAWTRREELWEQHYQSQFLFTQNSPMLRGGWIWISCGCVALLLAHLTAIPALAVLGLLLIPVGVVHRFFGIAVVSALRVPFLFALLTLPPPASIISAFIRIFTEGSTTAASTLLNTVGIANTASITQIKFAEYTIEVPQAYSGLPLLLPSLAFTLFLLLWRRASFFFGLCLLSGAALVALALNLVRICVVGALGANISVIGDLVNRIPEWIYVLVAAFILLRIARAVNLLPRPSDEDDDEEGK